MIKLLEVTNPLQPSVDRIDRELDHVEGETLEDLLRRCFEAEAVENLTVSLNGRILPSDYWFATTPRDGDCIVVVPKVQNPSLARTLGTLAIAAASIALIASGVGAPLGAALGFSGTTALAVGNGIVASAVSIGGGFIVSAIVSALTPSQKQQTPSYAFDGPHSLAQSGTVIPKGDGTMRWGGNVIASFIDIEGKDQFINALACYGFGPARSITEIQINGKDISEYGNVQYYTRLGTNDQGPIPNFNRIVNGYPQTTQLLAAQPVVVPGTGTLTQILQVDVVAQSGLWELTSLGHLIVREVTYLVEYAVAGSGAWQPVFQPRTTVDIVTFDPVTGIANPFPTWVAVATDLPPGSGVVYATSNGSHFPGQLFSATQSITFTNPDASTHSTSKTVTGEWQLTNPQLNQVEVTDWSAGYILFSGASQSPVYNRTNIYGLAPGKYDVRVTKYGSGRNSAPIPPGDQFSQNFGQDIWLHSVNEVALLDLAYPNMILIGVRALATGQLSGSQINITALIQHGLRTLDNNILPGALQAYEEDNPACIAADMMLDGLYGGGQSPGISEGNILRFIDEWVDWANLNDELVDDGNGGSIRRHVFNGVFDNESNLWDQLGAVGRMSRAQIIPLGRDYGVFVDKDDDPVQIFTMGNIVQDSFTETWLLIDDRANQIEIQFADSTRFYKQDNPIVYMDPANQDSGVPIKNVRIDGKGITLPAQAWHLARFKERGNQFLLRTGSFKTDTDGIASRPGNVIGLQHDVPQWGWGGRTLPGSTTISIAIDRTDVPFAGGTSYSLILLFPALSRYTGTITSVATVTDVTGATTGTQLNLSSFDNADRVTRAVVVAAGVTYDCPITSAAAGMVVIQPVPGFTPAAGQAYTLYDTDVLITSPVTGANATTVTLGTPLPAAPPDFSTWFYGPVGSLKLVRIVNIRKASEYRSTIEWIDKDSRVYVDGTPIIGETSAQITSNPGVTSLVGKEVLNLVSGSYIPYASLSWQLGPDTVGVSIYAQVVGSPIGQLPEMIARLTNFATSFQVQIAPNQATVYTVVGFDLNNHYAGFKSAPSVTVNGLGPTPNLLLNSNFSEGLAFWTATPRAGDTLVPDLQNGGESTYTVAGTDLTTSQVLLAQPIPPSEWAVGDYLMLSAYFMDTAVSTANIGLLEATITFLNASGGTVGTVNTVALLGGGGMVRVNTDSTQIPAGTAGVLVTISVAPHVPSGLHIHVGSTLSIATLLLEKSTSTQTAPGIWSGSPAGSQISTYTNVPQFALTQPTPTTIALAAVAVTFGNLVANYSARTFTIPTPSADTWYYVTIADAAQAGETGAVLSATCSTSFALAGVQGQTYMGAILAVAAGGSIRPQPGGWPVPNSLQVGV